MISPVYRGALSPPQIQALLVGYRYVVLILLSLALATPIAQAQSDDSPPTTRMHMVTTEDNTSQGVTPLVADIEAAAVLERYTFAIVTSPAHGEAAVVTAAQASRVSLAWDAVAAPNLAGYRIYYVSSVYPVDHESSCLDELSDADSIDVSVTETVAIIPDLEPGMTYCFGVKAYDDTEQESVFSNTLRYQLPQAGQLVYTPEPGFSGTDHFSYRATDSQGTSVIGTAQVTVMPATDAAPNPPPASAPVAAYSFDEGNGRVVFDASAYLNDGIISGATRTRQGRFGNALSFDGIDDWVTVEDHPSLHLTTGMTIEAWVYPTAAPGEWTWQPLVLKGMMWWYYLCLYADGVSTQPLTGVYTDDWQELLGETNLPLNTWTHLAATYDGSMMRFYMNGVEVASRPQSGLLQPSSGLLFIGGTQWAYFQGRIDEVRIYDRALNVEAIRADMQQPVAATD